MGCAASELHPHLDPIYIMVYRLSLLSDENDFFRRELLIDSEASFLQLNDFILDSLGYRPDELTSFYVCDEDWQKEEEITRMDMGSRPDEDSLLMADTLLEDKLERRGDHLFFVFDMLSERGLFIEVEELQPGKSLETPQMILSEGKAPKQIASFEESLTRAAAISGTPFEGEDFGDESFSEDELDLEGFDIADAESLY